MQRCIRKSVGDPGERAHFDRSPSHFEHIVRREACIEHDASVWLAFGDLEVGLPQAGVEAAPCALKTVRRTTAAARCRTRETDLDRNVKDQCDVRTETGERNPFERTQKSGIDLPKGALIGPRGISEAIADDPIAARQRRADRLLNMVDPRRLEHDGFGKGAVGLDCARQKDPADGLGLR